MQIAFTAGTTGALPPKQFWSWLPLAPLR